MSNKFSVSSLMTGIILSAVAAVPVFGEITRQEKVYRNIEGVRILSPSFDITAECYNGDSVVVQLYYPDNYYNVDIRSINGNLEITTRKRRLSAFFDDSNAGIVLKVPYYVKLDLSTTSGNIGITDSLAQKIINTVSGDINLQSCSGDIQVKTTSGNTELTDINGRIHAASLSGDISFNSASGILNIKSTSGRITGRHTDIRDKADFTTTSGEIDLEFLNPPEKLALSVKSLSGKIFSGGDCFSRNFNTEGTGFPVGISTTSGDIRIK